MSEWAEAFSPSPIARKSFGQILGCAFDRGFGDTARRG